MKVSKDQIIGIGILIASIVGIIVYGWLVFFVNPMLVLQITAFIAIAAILVILAWIGWVMATTPPPEPIEPELSSEEEKKEEKT